MDQACICKENPEHVIELLQTLFWTKNSTDIWRFSKIFQYDTPSKFIPSCKTKGRRVTIPEPRGKKSLPTKFSKTDDLPADCEPTTAI